MGERGNRILRLADRCLGVPLSVPSALWRRLENGFQRLADRDGEGPGPHSARAPRKVGVFCPGALGDAILLTALLGGIRSVIPQGILEFTGSAANAAILPLLPHVDRSFAFPIGHVPRIIAHLRQRKYDVLIDASQWARVGAIVAAFSGARATVGFRTPGQWRSLPYDVRVDHSPHCHEARNFLALGQRLWPHIQGQPHLLIPPVDTASSRHTIFCHMWPAPGPGRPLKQWPEDLWAELARCLLAKGFAVALTGAAADAPGCEDFLRRHFPHTPGIDSWAGKASLPVLTAHFHRCAAVVSVNTGILHLAAAAGAPTVGLHGATNPQRWGALGPRAINLTPEHGSHSYLNLGFEYPGGATAAMGYLPVANVLQALERLGVR